MPRDLIGTRSLSDTISVMLLSFLFVARPRFGSKWVEAVSEQHFDSDV